MTRAAPPSRALTARQVTDLLTGSAHAPDPETTGLAAIDAHALDDGRVVLVFENGRGRLYESRVDLIAYLADVAQRQPVHPLRTLLPQGRSFVDAVPRLADELPVASLDDIDGLVRRLGARAFLRPDTFPRLVAYVGEVIRRSTGGEWRMELAADGQTWEPWIVTTGGRRYAPFGVVLKELAEWGPASSLLGAVSGVLGAHRLR